MQAHLIAAASLFASLLSAQGTPFSAVVPTSANGAEAAASSALPFGSTLARHVLYAYDGSTVGYLAPVRIAGIELRCDGATPGTSTAGNYVFALAASTGKNPAAALDLTFANNHGADKVSVHSGALSLPAPAVGSSPNAFSLRIPFSTVFEWDPRNGPLVLDFAYSASTPAFGVWDAVASGVGGLAANGASAATATSVLTTAPVLRLDLAGDVTPAGFDSSPGQSGTSQPWNLLSSQAMRTLNLYEGSTMPFTGRRRITGLAWRTFGGAAYAGRTYNVRISLSTTSRTANNLTTTFADQIGADATVVFDGVLTAGSSPASADLSQFDLFCELQRPFEYDPQLGALSVDFQLRSATGPTGNSLDCTNQTTLAVARLNGSSGATATTGLSQTGVAMIMAMRTVPVPTAPVSVANAVNPVGGNATAFPFGTTACRSLQIISGADAILNQPTFVRALRFRPTANLTSYGPSTFTCTIDLSNPVTTPNTVGATFDANHGANRVRVFDGSFSVPFSTWTSTSTGFPIEIKLDRPFLWNTPNVPYLCIDVVMTSRTGPAITIETTNGLTTDDARVTVSNATATTGSTQSLAPTVQLSGDSANGLAESYGVGCTGTNGVPFCTTIGVPCLPNRDFRIRLRRGAGSTIAFLLMGFTSTNVPLAGAPGCALLHGLEFGTFGFAITDPTGDTSLPLPLQADPAFHGFPFRAQWLVLDPTANSLGLVASDAQLLTMKFF